MDKKNESNRGMNLLAGLCAVLFVTCFVMGWALISSQNRIEELEGNVASHTTSIAALTLEVEQLQAIIDFECPFEGTSLEGWYMPVNPFAEYGDPGYGAYVHGSAMFPTWRMCTYCLALYDYPWELECTDCDPDAIKARWIQELFAMDGVSVEIYPCPDNPGEFRWTNLERMDPITYEEWNEIIAETATRFSSIGGGDDER